jgi:hypothetical protein
MGNSATSQWRARGWTWTTSWHVNLFITRGIIPVASVAGPWGTETWLWLGLMEDDSIFGLQMTTATPRTEAGSGPVPTSAKSPNLPALYVARVIRRRSGNDQKDFDILARSRSRPL